MRAITVTILVSDIDVEQVLRDLENTGVLNDHPVFRLENREVVQAEIEWFTNEFLTDIS